MLTSKKFSIALILVVVFSIILTFLPLLGKLGYEYSVFSAIFLSFIAVFLAAELISDFNKRSFVNFNISDTLASILLLSLVLVMANFLIGFFSSVISGNCSISDGIKFYILIPLVSVFFATCLGALTGTIFGRRGFLIGSIVLILTIVYSLWEFYYQLPLFLYSPVFGYFPGPLYDRVIPINTPLILYRLRIVIWALILINLVHIIYDFKKNTFGTARFLLFLVFVILLAAGYYKQEDIGIYHSRDYIKKRYLTETYETENFIIHYSSGSWEDKNIALISKDHEWRYSQLKQYLNVDLDSKISSYLYPDVNTRKKIFGSYGSDVGNPIHLEIHLIYKSFPNRNLKHELVHVMSSVFGDGLLKISPKKGLIEGLAVAADWGGDGLSRHQWAKTILLNNEDVNVKDLLGYRFFYEPASSSYTLMGSFSRFLIEQYGIEKFKIFYKRGDSGVYKLSEDELISKWISFLNEKVVLSKNAKELSKYKFSEVSIIKDTCPRKTEFYLDDARTYFKEGNYKIAEKYFNDAARINKNNPNILTSLAYTYYYSESYDQLMNLQIEDLLEVDANIIRNLKYNVFWEKNGYDYAHNFFKKLSKKSIPEDLKRALDIKLELKNFNPNIRDSYLEYLKADNSKKRETILLELISDYRSFSPAYYLLGRLFLKNGDYERANKYCLIADRKGLPTIKLRKENLKLLGISMFALGGYLDSKNKFEDLLKIDTEKTYSNLANDFINRINWALNN